MTDTRTIKRSLMSWGTGRSYLPKRLAEGSAAVVVLENADHLEAVVHSDVVDTDTVVFTLSRFEEFPDLWTSDTTFKNLSLIHI